MISQKCWPSPSSLVPRMAAVPQLYSTWKLTFRLSQLSRVAEDLFRSSQTQSKSKRRGPSWGSLQSPDQALPTGPWRPTPASPCGPTLGAHAHLPPHSGSPCPGGPCVGCHRRRPHSDCHSHRRTPLSREQHWGWMVARTGTRGQSLSHCAGKKGQTVSPYCALCLPSAQTPTTDQWVNCSDTPRKGSGSLPRSQVHSWLTLPQCPQSDP